MQLQLPGFMQALQTLMQIHAQKHYVQLAHSLHIFLNEIGEQKIGPLTEEEENAMGMAGKVVLKIFSDSAFTIPDELHLKYINYSVLIANMVALTPFGNTDLVVKLLLEQNAPLEKRLPLYSYQNKITLDVEEIFPHNPMLVYGWWTIQILHGQYASISEESYRKRKEWLGLKALKKHPDFIHNQQVFYQAGFCSTYLDDTQQEYVKTCINNAVQRVIPSYPPLANPNPRKVTVVTSLFQLGHAVYKSLAPLIRQVKGEYELTLIYHDERGLPLDEQMFDKIVRLPGDDLPTIIAAIRSESPGIIIYPDIGMGQISLGMSNIRLAPIQIAMYGHPVSSYAKHIDYFIVSRDAEIVADLERNYSERAVVLPGIAAASEIPAYTLQHPPRPTGYEDKIIINCAWSSLKTHYETVKMLKRMIETSRSHLVFRFTDLFSGYLCWGAFSRDIKNFLGVEHVDCGEYVPYHEYMRRIEEADFALDSYPFGGYNRTIDALHCGVPMLTMETSKLYGRVSAVMLRRLGLQELIAKTPEEFIEKAVRLADDNAWRAELTDRLHKADLSAMLADERSAGYFLKAIEHLSANHERLRQDGTRKPIIIPE